MTNMARAVQWSEEEEVDHVALMRESKENTIIAACMIVYLCLV